MWDTFLPGERVALYRLSLAVKYYWRSMIRYIALLRISLARPAGLFKDRCSVTAAKGPSRYQLQ